MELTAFFKSVLDRDHAPIVLCDLDHTVIYMNQTAIDRYANRGGASLLGKSLLLCHNAESRDMIRRVVVWFSESPDHNRILESHNEKENKDVYMIALRDEAGTLIGYYEKHEYRSRETAKPYDFGA